jgi:hypothetical protein
MMKMNRVAGLLCAVVLVAVPGLSSAAVVAGGALSLSSPADAFGDVSGTGFGFAASAVNYFGKGPLALRVSGTGSWYGTSSLPVSGTGASGLSVDAKPTFFFLVGGPQIAKREGKVRPYANALIGFAHLSTTATLAGSGSTLSADEFQDDVLAYSTGVGILVPISAKLSLDAGVRFTSTGKEAEFPGPDGFDRSSSGTVSPRLAHEKVKLFEGLVGLTLAF